MALVQVRKLLNKLESPPGKGKAGSSDDGTPSGGGSKDSVSIIVSDHSSSHGARRRVADKTGKTSQIDSQELSSPLLDQSDFSDSNVSGAVVQRCMQRCNDACLSVRVCSWSTSGQIVWSKTLFGCDLTAKRKRISLRALTLPKLTTCTAGPKRRVCLRLL